MSDINLRQDILDELDYEPSIDSADIGVTVDEGTVTLTGHVTTYAQKRTAETIVRRVKGVRAIAQEIEVRPVGAHRTADDEIAKQAVNALSWHASVPRDAIQIKVSDGYLTLTGKVAWHYQRSEAERAVHDLVGVKGIANLIEIEPAAVNPTDVRSRIESALKRDAELEAKQIRVDVADHKVTLEGRVRTWAERQAAERAAWAAPGVTSVVDHISVSS